jgi:hypothetical protein
MQDSYELWMVVVQFASAWDMVALHFHLALASSSSHVGRSHLSHCKRRSRISGLLASAPQFHPRANSPVLVPSILLIPLEFHAANIPGTRKPTPALFRIQILMRFVDLQNRTTQLVWFHSERRIGSNRCISLRNAMNMDRKFNIYLIAEKCAV